MCTPAAPWLPVEDAAMLLSDANGPQQLCGAFEDRSGRASGLSESCAHSQKREGRKQRSYPFELIRLRLEYLEWVLFDKKG